MQTHGDTADLRAINALVARQFRALCWSLQSAARWNEFEADFLPEASLYPAARPPTPQTVAAFLDRMKALSQTTLTTFNEVVLGTEVFVFGNVAVAVAACEMTENEFEVSRGVEMILLVKDAGAWRIVSQAWDKETSANPIPAALLAGADEVIE